MVTPFYVPADEEVQLLKDLRQRKVRVRILTNSLESARPSSALTPATCTIECRCSRTAWNCMRYARCWVTPGQRSDSAMLSRYGNYALHAKLFVFDRQKLFIGSMNFDQRSKRPQYRGRLNHRQPGACAANRRTLRGHGAAGKFLRPGTAPGQRRQATTPGVAHRGEWYKPLNTPASPRAAAGKDSRSNSCRCCPLPGNCEQAVAGVLGLLLGLALLTVCERGTAGDCADRDQLSAGVCREFRL